MVGRPPPLPTTQAGILYVVEYEELDRGLRQLGDSVADRLSQDQQRWLDEFLDAGEYGIALEMIADWLSEDEAPMTREERSQAEMLAAAMGVSDRVMGALSLCPQRG